MPAWMIAAIVCLSVGVPLILCCVVIFICSRRKLRLHSYRI
jgi:Mn2+/Fe2+ NRAMP family transporter